MSAGKSTSIGDYNPKNAYKSHAKECILTYILNADSTNRTPPELLFSIFAGWEVTCDYKLKVYFSNKHQKISSIYIDIFEVCFTQSLLFWKAITRKKIDLFTGHSEVKILTQTLCQPN